MNNNTDIPTKALEWWEELSIDDKWWKGRLVDKYFPNKQSLDNSDIETIYRQEHGIKDSIKAMNDLEEDINAPFPNIQISEHGIEDEVRTETLEEAANSYSTKKMGERGTIKYTEKEISFIDGANWQKEQDKAIIQELSDCLKRAVNDFEKSNWTENSYNTFEAAITKAEQYLKQ